MMTHRLSQHLNTVTIAINYFPYGQKWILELMDVQTAGSQLGKGKYSQHWWMKTYNI